MFGRWLRQPSHDAAIVFVHGLNSSSEAWRSTSAFWPELILGEAALDLYGVYTFDYPSSISRTNYSVGDSVDLLKEMMRLDGIAGLRQIVFVCHSLGGNVVRRMLVSQSMDLRDRHVDVGLFLLASPSLGSHYASLVAMLSGRVHQQLDSLRFSQDNQWLNDLDKDFRNLLASQALNIRGKELVEDLPMFFPKFLPKTQVVPPHSAAKYFGDAIRIPLTDHCTISAPSGRDSLQHRLLVNFILNLPAIGPIFDRKMLEARVMDYLAAIDSGNVERAWSQLDDLARGRVVDSVETLAMLHDAVLSKLGRARRRQLVGMDTLGAWPGRPPGPYCALRYETAFDTGLLAFEQVVLRSSLAGWHVYEHGIQPTGLSETT